MPYVPQQVSEHNTWWICQVILLALGGGGGGGGWGGGGGGISICSVLVWPNSQTKSNTRTEIQAVQHPSPG